MLANHIVPHSIYFTSPDFYQDNKLCLPGRGRYNRTIASNQQNVTAIYQLLELCNRCPILAARYTPQANSMHH
jgi:hypothetical protein